MKKLLCLVLALVFIFTLCSCSEKEKTPSQNDGETVAQSTDVKVNSGADESVNVDVDLTALSSTMIYSEVNNMMTTPDDYLGKTVKMSGSFSIYESESTGKIYYACVIADATACCSQGLEFVLAEERSYPDEYPELGTEITVTGVFDTYEENGYMYCQLIDAVMG